MRAAALLLCLPLAVSRPAPAQDTLTYEQRITRLTKSLALIRENDDAMRAEADKAYRDLRGRTARDDINQWVFPPEFIEKVLELLEKARAAQPGSPTDELNEADSKMYAAFAVSEEVQEYWSATPQITWRDRWKAFATANGLPADAPDPTLLAYEKSLLEALGAGRFRVAASLSASLDERLIEDIRRSSSEVLKLKKPEDIVFVPRTTPCPASDGSTGSASARLVQSSDPESWYPDGAKDRGEHGAIVLRARIATDNCATAFAVMVSSGYPELDAAAIKVAEASRYTAAVESRKPVASELTFKVRFDLKDDPSP